MSHVAVIQSRKHLWKYLIVRHFASSLVSHVGPSRHFWPLIWAPAFLYWPLELCSDCLWYHLWPLGHCRWVADHTNTSIRIKVNIMWELLSLYVFSDLWFLCSLSVLTAVHSSTPVIGSPWMAPQSSSNTSNPWAPCTKPRTDPWEAVPISSSPLNDAWDSPADGGTVETLTLECLVSV